KPDYSTQLIKSEIIKFKNIIKYENMKKKTIKKETKTVLKNPEFKKAEKKIRKFVWNGTEEGILRIIDLLFNSGFLTKESYKIRNAIIRDSFQKLDENNQIIDFKNTQLSSVNSQRLKEEKIKADNKDYNKFINLQKGLKKVIPD
ncbi:MAG: hypothetical protein NTU73_05910, partial [Ignavibacteriae bacterium]|nr:hypothetical protein [Ignavibacteriota bacterium]